MLKHLSMFLLTVSVYLDDLTLKIGFVVQILNGFLNEPSKFLPLTLSSFGSM